MAPLGPGWLAEVHDRAGDWLDDSLSPGFRVKLHRFGRDDATELARALAQAYGGAAIEVVEPGAAPRRPSRRASHQRGDAAGAHATERFPRRLTMGRRA
jgi:hypothetical protein